VALLDASSLRTTDLDSRPKRREFLAFLRAIHRGNPAYRDLQAHLAESFLDSGDRFLRQCRIRPVQVLDHGVARAQAMLVTHPDCPYQQVAFLDFLPDSADAVARLLAEARDEARRNGLSRLAIGLDGHVSYGVGFLANRFDQPISFDSLYSPPWVVPTLDSLGLERRTLSTYRIPLSKVSWSPAQVRAGSRIQVRPMDKRRFRDEIALFGRLANECLADTPLYFPRDPLALVELLAPIRALLRPEHLLFSLRDGRETGFLFWHPDFNEVLPGGRRTPLAEIALRSLLLGGRIRHAKLNALGILPRERGSGAAPALLQDFTRHAGGRFESAETNFVWDDNHASTLLNRRRMDGPERIYHVYFQEATS